MDQHVAPLSRNIDIGRERDEDSGYMSPVRSGKWSSEVESRRVSDRDDAAIHPCGANIYQQSSCSVGADVGLNSLRLT